jgi:antitoxin ParD1/3/4
MSRTQSLSITLPDDMAQMVKEKVATGEYASESEVVHDGLRALQARDAAVERWLREEVAASVEEVARNPSRVIPSDRVLDRIQARVKAAEE